MRWSNRPVVATPSQDPAGHFPAPQASPSTLIPTIFSIAQEGFWPASERLEQSCRGLGPFHKHGNGVDPQEQATSLRLKAEKVRTICSSVEKASQLINCVKT